MKNFNKENIAKELSENTGLSHFYSKKIINDLIRILVNNIPKSGLNLKNFGVFKILEKKKRLGRNPKTMKVYTINARKVVKFSPSHNIKKSINLLNG